MLSPYSPNYQKKTSPKRKKRKSAYDYVPGPVTTVYDPERFSDPKYRITKLSFTRRMMEEALASAAKIGTTP